MQEGIFPKHLITEVCHFLAEKADVIKFQGRYKQFQSFPWGQLKIKVVNERTKRKRFAMKIEVQP